MNHQNEKLSDCGLRTEPKEAGLSVTTDGYVKWCRITALLIRYQVSPLTRLIQHVEYEQIEDTLAVTRLPVLFVSVTSKTGINLKAPTAEVTIVGSASLVPNYIKVELSSFTSGSQVVFSSLAYKRIRILSVGSTSTLATLA